MKRHPDSVTQNVRGHGTMTASMMRQMVVGVFKAEGKALPDNPVSDAACPACKCEAWRALFEPFAGQVVLECAGCGRGAMAVAWAESPNANIMVRVKRMGEWVSCDLSECTDDEVRSVVENKSREAVVEWLIAVLRAMRPADVL